MPELEQFNSLAREESVAELLKCCGSSRWAARVADARPFESFAALVEEADRAWWSLGREDWLEAFRSHPKIGERKAERETGAQAGRWSEQEQSGTRDASSEVMSELAEANREYEARFGYIFIVCAAGRSAEEMLALLRARLRNDAETELRVAAEEQRRITRLRLQKSFAQEV